MPWQSAPPLIIIGGAFALTGALLSTVDKLSYGRVRRVQIDEFTFNMDKRDKFIKDAVVKAEKAAKEKEKADAKLAAARH